jgi:tetratricopeptide (TPR) repeat protein
MHKPIVFLLLLVITAPALAQRRENRPVAPIPNIPGVSGYQLALPKLYPNNLPSPLSGQYYTDPKNIPRYEMLKFDYQDKIAELQAGVRTSKSDSLLLNYLHDVVLIRELLYGENAKGNPRTADSTMAFLQLQKDLSQQLKVSRFYFEALNRLESLELARNHLRSALGYALERIALFEKVKTTCNTCNDIPKNYITAATYYTRLNEHATALAYYQKAVDSSRLAIDKEFAMQQLAAYQLSTGNPLKALETIEMVENDSLVYPHVHTTYKTKATILLNLKRFDKALEYTNRALTAERTLVRNNNRKFDSSVYDALLSNIYLGLNQPYKALLYSNNAEMIEKVKQAAEQEKVLQDQKVLSANQKLEIEKLNFESEKRRKDEMAQKQYLLSSLEKAEIRTKALRDRLQQESKIKLLDRSLDEQSRVRRLLFSGIGILVTFLCVLVWNSRQKRKAYTMLNETIQGS